MKSDSSSSEVHESVNRRSEFYETIRKDVKMLIEAHKFLKQVNIPRWYCPLTEFQKSEGEMLYAYLRDDTEQNTTHRLHAALFKIGLFPLITANQIYDIMKISYQSDIAFLWFLMQLYYKPDNNWKSKRKFNLNEQIIMSLICHLDMIPTLRALDKLLPPGHESLKSGKHIHKTSSANRNIRIKKSKQWFTVKLSGREENKSKSMIKIWKQKRYRLPYFDKLKPPLPYKPPTKTKKLNIRIDFDNFEKYANPRFQMPGEEFRWFAHFNVDHRQSIRQQIMDIIKQLDYMPRKSALQKLIAKGNTDGNQKLTNKELIYLEMSREILRDCIECTQRKSRKDSVDSIASSKRFSAADRRKRKKALSYLRKKVIRHIGEGDSNFLKRKLSEIKSLNDCGCEGGSGDGRSFEETGDFNYNKEPSESIQLTLSDSATTASESFFSAPMPNKPYCFDYFKIFNFENDNELKTKINKTIINALEVDDSLECNAKNINEAIRNIVIRFLCKKREPIRRESQDKWESYYEKKYFDCDDDILMETLLKDGLKEISKDPFYILATFPEAYKVDILREWVKRRYGKRYTEKDIKKLQRQSDHMYNSVQKFPLLTKIPDYHDLKGPCAKDAIKDFKLRLLNAVMARTRLLWYSFGPYLKSNFLATFNTYLTVNAVHNHNHIHTMSEMGTAIRSTVWPRRFSQTKRFNPVY